jgi:hypothetical protein
VRDTSPWSVSVPRAISIYANAVFLVLWVGFVIALVVNRDWLDAVWAWAQALPLILRILVWVLLLPIMVALWIWHSSWPSLPRLVGLVAIAAWTLLAVSSLFKAFGGSTPTGRASS